MNSPELPLDSEVMDEKFVVTTVATCIESVIEDGVDYQPPGRTRVSAWARDFYGALRNEIATNMIDDDSLAEISKRGQGVAVGELAESQNIVVTRYSKTTSPDPESQRGICITWGYEAFGDNQTKFFQTLVQVGSETEGWNQITTINMPQIVAEFKTIEMVDDNDCEFGLQREIPGWAKIAGGVGVTAVTAAVLAIGTKFTYGKLKNR